MAFRRDRNRQRRQCSFPQGAWLAARQWARAPGPDDWSVREPLPSTGQRCWSCSAVSRRLRASQVPHTQAAPRVPRSRAPCLLRRRGICGRGSRRAPHPPPPAPARSHPTVPCPFCWSRLRYEHRKNSPPDLRNRELTQPSLLVSDVRPGVPCVL